MRFRTVLLAVIALVTTAYFYKPQLASYIESFSVPAHPSAKYVSRARARAHAPRLVESLIKQTKTLVFSKSYCPHSRNAIALLESLDAGATVLQLDQREDGPSIQVCAPPSRQPS